jgi:hypothetical protein
MKYEVVFDRISRNHNVPNLTVEAADADELAEKIWDYARPKCVSSDIEVSLRADEGVGIISAGVQVAGTFKFKVAS